MVRFVRFHREHLLFWRGFAIVLAFAALLGAVYAANVNARIRGSVADPSDAVIPGAQITATNTATGVMYKTTSGQDGGYLFPQLPIGSYTVTATAPGFQTFSATGIVLRIDQEYVQPIHMTIGTANEVVQVSASAIQVDTTDMQFSNIVDSKQMIELPLMARNFANLQLTLPGVQAASGSERIAGSSVSGSQQQQSAFLINGADTNDIALNSQMISPILDAVQQFNLIDGPLNAEYSRNSGGIISASIKSGTNQYHGDVFDYYRDTFLNTNNFFQKSVDGTPTPVSPYHQHIAGATAGGPILKNKLFIFGAFQATPARAPETPPAANANGNAVVYSQNNLNGDFSLDVAGTGPSKKAFSNNLIPSTISIPGCAKPDETWSQCFGAAGTNGAVPTTAFNTIALALVKQYVPAPNSGTSGYVFNMTNTSTNYQEDGRVDFNPNPNNQFSFVGIYLALNSTETLPFSGATLPGFGDGNVEHIQQYTFDYVHQFGPTAVNDFAAHWTRMNYKSSFPQQVVQPSTAGFGITPQDATASTIPRLVVSGFFTLGGTSNGPQPRIDQNYQLEDNFSKTWGRHSLKFGWNGSRFNVSNVFDAVNSGSYTFANTSSSKYTTGDPSLDFLLGIPATYSQGTGSIIQADAFLNYFYAQDTWKVNDALTLNYGLGYSIDTPLRNHQYGGLGVGCFIPGQQSTVFSGSPIGLNYPGDPGCTFSGQATMRYNELGPRVGFAWSPNLGALSGGPGQFVIRGGYGIYYNRTEEEGSLQTLGTPPFGFTSTGAADFGGSPQLANPFADIDGGRTTTGGTASESNRFPYAQPAAGSTISFADLEPIYNISGFAPTYQAPYAQNFQLSVERGLGSKLVARVSYVGSLARHNQTAYEANPETAAGHAACLANQTCIADQNTQALDFPANKLANSTGIIEMGAIGSESSANYNALQVSIQKGETHGLLFQLSYTYAHSMDTGSSFENTGFGNSGARGYNQYQPSLNYGDSTFDTRHRVVISPVYMVPFRHGGNNFDPLNLALSGWEVSGIMTFATGMPYDISYGGWGTSASLYCDIQYSFYACPDIPNQIASLSRQNPRLRDGSGNGTWFNGSSTYFADETTGSFGNIHRNPYHGPGINNTNIVLAKNFSLGGEGTRSLQLRMESDNAFNHTQFSLPDGLYGDGTFGQITSAAAARQTQLAARITF